MSWLRVPRTLRARLTVWHVSVVVLVLALYAAVVLLLVTRNLSRSLDARLRSDVRWASEMAQQGSDGSLSWFEGDPWRADSPWLRVSASSDNAVLEVHDTGPGIPEGDQARLFDRLYRGRNSASGGSGLGLSIARWAVEANQGQLSYDHQVNGSGSTFRITLPAAATSASDAPTES